MFLILNIHLDFKVIHHVILRLNLGLIEFRLDDGAPTFRNRNLRLWAKEHCWRLPNLDWDADHVTFTPLVPGVVLYKSEQKVFNREELAANRTTELVVQDCIMVSPSDVIVGGLAVHVCQGKIE